MVLRRKYAKINFYAKITKKNVLLFKIMMNIGGGCDIVCNNCHKAEKAENLTMILYCNDKERKSLWYSKLIL